MFLDAGVRLGAYEILSALGAGGMGEVYRARDTKLGRDVAIKILPEIFVADPERVARFEREAQLLAALNHPHIAQIYGLERQEANSFIVMELVEGETLAERLCHVGADPRVGPGGGHTGPPLPVEEALAIARQIINALEAAHERGIVHRDLKPANVMLTNDAQVKVLDFGLAKFEAGGAGQAGGAGGLTHSPTLTFAATQAGTILGTAAYMAPEQAKGRAADKRCDVWAFGCVLFEMLAGKRAFDGEDATDVIAAIVRGEPDWKALPAGTPPAVAAILRRCLDKDRKTRIPDLSVVRFLMDDTTAVPATSGSPEGRAVVAWQRVAPWALASAAIAGVAVWALMRSAPVERPLIRLQATPPASAPIVVDDFAPDIAFAPDGSRLAYTAGGSSQLYIRALNQKEGTPLTGILGVRGPFFSPDGEWIAYFQGGDLKKVSAQGGPAVTICTACASGNRGAHWGADDTIVFSASGGTQGLSRISAAGGEKTVLTKVDGQKGDAAHTSPEFLPGERAVLFTILSGSGAENALIAVRDLKTGEQSALVRGGSHPHYVATGHIVYGAAGTLRAIRFDLARLSVVGNPVPVVDHVVTKPVGTADFSVSRNGSLAYISGDLQASGQRLAWIDRQGHEEPIAAPPRGYVYSRLSPDGHRVALDTRDSSSDIWIWDLSRQVLTRLTTDPAADQYPVWTPDGRRIAYSSNRGGAPNLFWQASDGTGTAERLTTSPQIQYPWAFTPDGKSLILRDTDPKTGADIALMTLEGERTPKPLIHSRFDEANAELSPDGRWIAYQSDESGRAEVYVRPFPAVDSGHWQVSTNGGSQPLWARNGRELFFVDAVSRRIMAVPVQTSPSFTAGNATVAVVAAFSLAGSPGRVYDVSSDGKRFLVIRRGSSDDKTSPAQLNVVLNWGDELARLLPAKR